MKELLSDTLKCVCLCVCQHVSTCEYLHTDGGYTCYSSSQYVYVTVTTCLTAVHISQGGEPCIAVLVHGSHALYVRAAQGQTTGGELKLHPRAHLSACGVAYYPLMYFCVLKLCLQKAAGQEIH